MKKILLIVWMGMLCFSGLSQPEKDSLLKLLPSAKDDTAKVLLYIDIGNQYELDDPKTAGKYYLLAADLSKRLHYKRGIIKYISNYTAILNIQGMYDSSLVLNKQSVQYAKEINDELALAKVYANTGNSFQFLSQYDSAIFYYEMAREYFERTGNVVSQARMYDLLQNTYRELDQTDKALQLSKKAMSLLRNSNADSMYLAMAIINLATNYSYSQPDSSLKYFNEGLELCRRLNYKEGEATCLNNIGSIYYKKYDIDKMKPYYEAAYQLSRELGLPYGESTAGRGLAFHYLLKNNYNQAKNYIERSLVISDSIGSEHEKFENMKALASILYAMHDIVGAEKCLDSASKIEKQITGNEIQDKILVLEKKFETEKKEAQIKLQQSQLRQKNILNYFLIAGAVALLAISLLTYRNYRNRQKLQQAKIDELEAEKQLTAIEAVLKGEEQERTRLAKDLHDGLGGMLSGIKYSLNNMKGNLIMTPDNAQAFERSIDMLDSSIREMRRVAHNMMPEVLVKYGLDTALQEFCSEVNRSGALQVNYHSMGMNDLPIPQTTALTIYRIVQELVHNAMKHAAAKNVLVQAHLSKAESLLAITVEDDGKGFNVAVLKNATGIGWSNIQNRVEFLKGKTDIQSAPGEGTSVLVEVGI